MESESKLGPTSLNNSTSLAEVNRFAILLPVTSRGTGAQVVENMKVFLNSFQDTATTPPAVAGHGHWDWRFEFFVGVDAGDPVLDPHIIGAISFQSIFATSLPTLPFVVAVRRFSQPPGSICTIWRE